VSARRLCRKAWPVAIALCVLAAAGAAPARGAEPLRAHPENARLPIFRGRPTLLVGSTEHYGAVLNPDFDHRRYLDTVAASGLNLIRLFTGAYLEKQGDFGIRLNTLAPASRRALVPWARSETPGYRLGGNRFDLDRWDPAYFARLKAVVTDAAKRGIVAEVTLFSAYYGGGWELSPLHPDNNVNGTPRLPKERVQTLDDDGLIARQEALVRKLVAELAPFDNIFYEIQNEPWADRAELLDFIHPYLVREDMKDEWRFWKNKVEGADAASRAWQARMVRVIRDVDGRLGVRHLVAQNYANFGYPLRDGDPDVDIVNFHYAWPRGGTRGRDGEERGAGRRQPRAPHPARRAPPLPGSARPRGPRAGRRGRPRGSGRARHRGLGPQPAVRLLRPRRRRHGVGPGVARGRVARRVARHAHGRARPHADVRPRRRAARAPEPEVRGRHRLAPGS